MGGEEAGSEVGQLFGRSGVTEGNCPGRLEQLRELNGLLPYTGGPFVYQALAPLKPHDGRYPVVGSWVVNNLACGIGIREDDSLITRNTSRFVPHQMVG